MDEVMRPYFFIYTDHDFYVTFPSFSSKPFPISSPKNNSLKSTASPPRSIASPKPLSKNKPDTSRPNFVKKSILLSALLQFCKSLSSALSQEVSQLELSWEIESIKLKELSSSRSSTVFFTIPSTRPRRRRYCKG